MQVKPYARQTSFVCWTYCVRGTGFVCRTGFVRRTQFVRRTYCAREYSTATSIALLCRAGNS
jgi:hypothetical protein